jgi:hypothetical protein
MHFGPEVRCTYDEEASTDSYRHEPSEQVITDISLRTRDQQTSEPNPIERRPHRIQHHTIL